MFRRAAIVLSLLVFSLSIGGIPVHAEPPVLLGVYPWGHDLAETVININAIDAWLAPVGKRIAIAGDFLDIEFVPTVTVPVNLGTAWDNGRVPFIKLLAVRSAAQVNSGLIDGAISAWGHAFALWSEGGTKKAFIALLPEMNGDWTPYYGRPEAVVPAWRRIRNLIKAELTKASVPQNAISWVYAPNGWSLPGDEFELYYPGHDEVDVVAFSAYNWGACPSFMNWLTYDNIFGPDLQRMAAMAPGKPIFIAETAVIDRTAPFPPLGDRNAWFFDSYTRLAAFPRLRGIMYFDKILPTQPNLPNCPNPDFRLHLPGTGEWRGFMEAVANPGSNFGYWPAAGPEIAIIAFSPTVPHVFADVHPIHPFAMEDGEVDFSPWIHKLAASKITSGCNDNPPRFCPTDGVTRAQMSVFLLRGMHGAGYSPPPPTGAVFFDVTFANVFAKWIEELAAEGITGGCGTRLYCPDGQVTRAEMAVFLLRAKFGGNYSPPPATGAVFTDVLKSNPFAAWIEQLALTGITGGCGGSSYCPNAVVTRQQMAVFLVRAFGL